MRSEFSYPARPTHVEMLFLYRTTKMNRWYQKWYRKSRVNDELISCRAGKVISRLAHISMTSTFYKGITNSFVLNENRIEKIDIWPHIKRVTCKRFLWLNLWLYSVEIPTRRSTFRGRILIIFRVNYCTSSISYLNHDDKISATLNIFNFVSVFSCSFLVQIFLDMEL